MRRSDWASPAGRSSKYGLPSACERLGVTGHMYGLVFACPLSSINYEDKAGGCVCDLADTDVTEYGPLRWQRSTECPCIRSRTRNDQLNRSCYANSCRWVAVGLTGTLSHQDRHVQRLLDLAVTWPIQVRAQMAALAQPRSYRIPDDLVDLPGCDPADGSD